MRVSFHHQGEKNDCREQFSAWSCVPGCSCESLLGRAAFSQAVSLRTPRVKWNHLQPACRLPYWGTGSMLRWVLQSAQTPGEKVCSVFSWRITFCAAPPAALCGWVSSVQFHIRFCSDHCRMAPGLGNGVGNNPTFYSSLQAKSWQNPHLNSHFLSCSSLDHGFL